MQNDGTPAYIEGKTITLRTFENQVIPAGSQREFAAEGTQFYVLESDGVLLAQFDGAGEAKLDKSVGFEVQQGASPFTKITIKNPSAIDDITVTFTVTDGRITDNRSSVTAASALPVDILSYPNAPLIATGAQIAVAAVGSTPIVAENQSRTKLLIQNIGSVLVQLNGFWRLDVGETLELIFRDAVTAETLTADAGKVQIFEG